MYPSFSPNHIDTQFLFLTGKGGVGKTSTACATAVALADSGKKVLLISTDPASNLQDVFGIELTSTPKAVPVLKIYLRVISTLKLQQKLIVKVLSVHIAINFQKQ